MKKLLIVLMLLPAVLFAQRDWANLPIEVTQLAPGLHRLFVNNSVAVVVFEGPNGLLVIDAAYDQSTDRLMEEIQKISRLPITHLINTHLHGDHTGGNKVLGKDATIIAHASVREFLSKEQRRGENVIPAFPEYALPDKLVEGSMELDLGGETIQIKHLEGGHTTGDLVIFFPKANVLVIGDLLFAGYFPFVDTSNGGNPMKYMENLSTIMNQFPSSATVVGGHGPVYSMEQLAGWQQTLAQTMEVVKNAKASGMDAKEMKEKRILKEYEAMGSFFITEDRWIDTLFPFL
jgi:cyclase